MNCSDNVTVMEFKKPPHRPVYLGMFSFPQTLGKTIILGHILQMLPLLSNLRSRVLIRMVERTSGFDVARVWSFEC